MAEYVYIAEMENSSGNIVPRYLKKHLDPFNLTENEFISRFRLSKTAAKHLCDTLKPHLNIKQNAVSLETQVLIALRILGSGSFQNVVSDSTFGQVSQASASRYLQNVVEALVIVAEDFISFPETTEDVLEIQRKCYEKKKFPNVVGAIDCTHVYIEKPKAPDFFMYMNRKGRYSLNMQVICDSELKILDVVARWPGSTHDAFIWNQSDLSRNFRNGSIPCDAILLGDSGYPLEPFLMVPYLDPGCPSEHLFNKKHRSTRNVVERCFGVLKSRFQILSGSGGSLRYQPLKVSKIFIACCVLHNLCIEHRLGDPPMQCTDDDELNDATDTDLFNVDADESDLSQAMLIRTKLAMGFQSAT